MSSFEYATVIKVDEDRGRITLRRIGAGGSWRQKPSTLAPAQWLDTTRFWRFVWMDDHALIELDTPGRLVATECALRSRL